MKIYIPAIDSEITLAKEWIFTVHRDGYNDGFAKAFEKDGSLYTMMRNDGKVIAELPENTILVVRKIKHEHVSFTIKECAIKRLKRKRVHVVLADANTINFK